MARHELSNLIAHAGDSSHYARTRNGIHVITQTCEKRRPRRRTQFAQNFVHRFVEVTKCDRKVLPVCAAEHVFKRSLDNRRVHYVNILRKR